MRRAGGFRWAPLFATIAFLATPQMYGAARIGIFGLPGASATIANGINRSGTVVGYYFDSKFTGHGYLRSPRGSFTTFDVPGASQGDGQGTFPLALNDVGGVAGTYTTSALSYHGFIRDAAGNIETFDAPGETLATGESAMGMNNNGQIVGVSFSATAVDVYIRDSDGTFTIFNPGGNAGYVGINSLGEVAGTYSDTTFRAFHGFVRDVSGTVTTFDVPGAMENTPGYGTWAYTINDSGVAAGFWVDQNFVGHGYLRSPSGTIKSYNAPKGTTFGGGTYINVGGEVASTSYNAANSTWIPFTRDHAGSTTTFQVSDSTNAIIYGINRNGQVCGTFTGKKGIGYGFLRTP